LSGSDALRVCITVPFDLSEPGGVKHHAMQLARSLRQSGDEVVVIGPASRPIHESGVIGFRGVINLVSNGSNNAIGLFVRPWEIWRFFRQHHFDLIHIQEPSQPTLNYWSVWATPYTPHIATFHSFGERQPLLQAVARGFGVFQFPFIQRGLAVSPAAAAFAGPSWRRPLKVIPNGVRADVFRPGAAVSGRAVNLLFVGRISDERKGLRYLLEAFRQLRADGHDVELNVVGDNTNGVVLPDLPGLTYHGALPMKRLVEEYQRADVLVAPSTGQESFGIVLLEAMACGKAVISSDITGYRWASAAGGVIQVPPREVGHLVAAIGALALDRTRLRAMGQRNRVHALRYDWRHVAQNVREQYLSTIAASRTRALPPLPTPRELGDVEPRPVAQMR
jgi:phosphatidylinositol alpha-mannosyltransferase